MLYENYVNILIRIKEYFFILIYTLTRGNRGVLYMETHSSECLLYTKLVSLNCINFEYDCCNFSKTHMDMKDAFEDLSKEGCARV